MIIELFSRTIAFIGNFTGDLRCISTTAFGKYDRQRIKDVISSMERAESQLREQFFKQESETRAEEVEAIIEGLIRRKVWKPSQPMSASIVIDAALEKMTLKMTEQINGHQFLVGKSRLVIVAHTLKF